MLVKPRVALIALMGAVFAAGGSGAPVPAERAKAEKELAAVAAQLNGVWRGGPCEGTITFRENGTYTWTGIGPGGNCHEGKWVLRGDPTQPVLAMECRKSFDRALSENLELRVVRVAASEFEFKTADAEKHRLFERVKTKSPAGSPKEE
jgi:hypothetical protein